MPALHRLALASVALLLTPWLLAQLPPAPLLPTPANPALHSLFLVGDSTVHNGTGDGASGQWGWGEPLAALFDPAKINVVNRAISGRSSRTYITEGQWAATLALVKPGDFVLIQFGHNDEGPIDEPTRARGSLPGLSDDFRQITNPVTHQPEAVHTFGWYLREMVVESIAHGATPIVCSPVPRRSWQNGHIQQSQATYAGWAGAIAVQQRVPFLDLNAILARRYDSLGETTVAPLFADDATHTTAAGAELSAEAVVAGLKALHPDPLAGLFSAKGNAIPAAIVPPPPSPAAPTSLLLPTAPATTQP